MPQPNVVLIIYTTQYREGGSKFPRVAHTLAGEKARENPDAEIIVRAVESKRDVRALLHELIEAGRFICDLHYFGHSGLYGPMFGTVAFPEQFSPYEWETLRIPFTDGATVSFHSCRSARWFAPYFARTFGVVTYGYFWYTTFSTSPAYYRPELPGRPSEELYAIGCKGRKSHGLFASAVKRAGMMPAEAMIPCRPAPPDGDVTYNAVADLYDRVFTDIRVRADEWNWLLRHLPDDRSISVLDIGCGNGALLRALADRIAIGVGVDESAALLAHARERSAAFPHLSFRQVGSPALPFDDDSFDVVISLLSFRYLDWDPLMAEIKRVAVGRGILLVIDMVTVPLRLREYPRWAIDTMRGIAQRFRHPEFRRNLKHLVRNPHWKNMLAYNPMRSEHEMKWYLESRFPGRRVETLNIGRNARIVAFDAGAVEREVEVPLTYP